jgi:hypothetical protein
MDCTTFGIPGHDFVNGHCDGHANSLTLILDTRGNIFVGFRPVEWQSSGFVPTDPSLKSLLLTPEEPRRGKTKYPIILSCGLPTWVTLVFPIAAT